MSRTPPSLSLIALAAICLTGCPAPENKGKNSGSGKDMPGPSGGIKVAFVSNNAAEFWTLAEAGARKGEKESGVQVIFKRPQDGTAATQKPVSYTHLTLPTKA